MVTIFIGKIYNDDDDNNLESPYTTRVIVYISVIMIIVFIALYNLNTYAETKYEHAI